MRLIDADKIIDSLGNSDMDFAIGAVIDEQPTAFDVDKVSKQLKDLKAMYWFSIANTGDKKLDVAYENGELYWLKDVAELLEELKSYKEAEEQGLFVRLPCKVGDTVWVVTSPINVFGYDEYDGDAEYEVYESFLSSVSYYASGEQFRIYAKVTNSFIVAYFRECDFGKSIFLTREEAEKKLEEMKNEI